MASSIGRAVLKIIDEENLMQNITVLSKMLQDGLFSLQKKYSSIIGDVRGVGFMQGIDLVKNVVTKEYNAEAALKIINRAKDFGLIIIRGGNGMNCIRFLPPYCINKEDIKFCL